MGRKCSYCGSNGHNSRTCNNNSKGDHFGMKLFGVHLQILSSSMEKCLSMECLSSTPPYPSSSSSPASSTSSTSSSTLVLNENTLRLSGGYLSDGLFGRNGERRKGVPWSEEEHRVFLVGLEKLGKGDWRGISRRFVTTRTPTQVASHAQKYFLRQNSLGKKKRRSSLFDAIERLGRACHSTETYVNSSFQGTDDRPQNEFNPTDSCLNLMPVNSSITNITNSVIQGSPSSDIDQTQVVRFSIPDLELRISSSKSIDHNTICVTSIDQNMISV